MRVHAGLKRDDDEKGKPHRADEENHLLDEETWEGEAWGEKPWWGRSEKQFLFLFPKPVLITDHVFNFNPIKSL